MSRLTANGFVVLAMTACVQFAAAESYSFGTGIGMSCGCGTAEAYCGADAGGCGNAGCGCESSGCGCGNGGCLSGLLGDSCGAGSCLTSLFQPSDHCFDDFISPITNPVFFEDPRTLTEARFIFINHHVPAALGGHSADLFALQVRAALTEDLSIIATKDGFVTSDNPLIRDGWADIAAGLKLNVYKDAASQTLLSIGGTYEMPVGTPRTLQGNGDGEFHLFATGGTEFLDDTHWISGSGFRLPVDTNAESTVWYWSNHVDRKLGNSGFYLLGEANWYHWIDGGTAFPVAVEGLDLFNLGSIGVGGNDIVTAAIGLKYKPSANMEIGFAWEAPLTDRRDILDDRYTIDWIFRY
ncbi:MAG: hypothetical protein R3C19_11140 [Planctomycetaceae bacterium]